MSKGTEFSEAVAIEICSRIAGGEPLTKICRDGAMPNTSTVYKWLSQKESFLKLYNTARADQAHSLFNEMLEIADDTAGDTTVDAESGRITTNFENINRSRLRVDARKFACARLLPKVYGEANEVAGKPAIEPPAAFTPKDTMEGVRRIIVALRKVGLEIVPIDPVPGNLEGSSLRLMHKHLLERVDLHGNPMPHRDLMEPS